MLNIYRGFPGERVVMDQDCFRICRTHRVAKITHNNVYKDHTVGLKDITMTTLTKVDSNDVVRYYVRAEKCVIIHGGMQALMNELRAFRKELTEFNKKYRDEELTYKV